MVQLYNTKQLVKLASSLNPRSLVLGQGMMNTLTESANLAMKELATIKKGKKNLEHLAWIVSGLNPRVPSLGHGMMLSIIDTANLAKEELIKLKLE